MMKFLKVLASIGMVVEQLVEIHDGIKVLETDLAQLKCELARQGEELDLLYTQHCQATSAVHNRRATDN
jgi:hypothetical protein